MSEPTTPNVDEEVLAAEPTPEEPIVEEVVEPVEEEKKEQEPEEEPEEPEVPAPSRRETLRIQQLIKRYGNPEDKPEPYKPSREALDYQTALDADPEVIQQLEADRRREGENQYSQGLQRAEFLDWKTSLKIDAPTIEKKFPILDPQSTEFHPAVADAVNNWYLQMSGFNPNTQTVNNAGVSYSDFVEGYMELVQETAGQKNSETVKNVAKQAAQSGLRPDGSSAKRLNLNKAPEDMSIEELYAKIGQRATK